MTTTTHPTYAGLLAAVLENPEDDDVRLIFADWLDDDGQAERAEFIRLQIAHEWYPGGPMEDFRAGRDQDELERCERELLTPDNFWQWFGDNGILPAWPGSPAVHIQGTVCEVGYFGPPNRPHWELTVCRGFIESVSLPAEAWLANATALTASHPIREVTLTTALNINHSLVRREFAIVGLDVWVSEDEVWRGHTPMNPPSWETVAEKILAKRWPRTTFIPPA